MLAARGRLMAASPGSGQMLVEKFTRLASDQDKFIMRHMAMASMQSFDTHDEIITSWRAMSIRNIEREINAPRAEAPPRRFSGRQGKEIIGRRSIFRAACHLATPSVINIKMKDFDC